MAIKFSNANILDNKTMTLRLGEVVVDGAKIAYVGDKYRGEITTFSNEIDLDGKILACGLKNCHTHSGMSLLRGVAEDLPLDRWLNECIFKHEKFIGEEEVYYGTKLAILQYLQSGTTSVLDMYFHPKAIEKAFNDCGFSGAINGADMDISKPTDLVLQQLEDDFLHFKGSKTRFYLGIHSIYTCSKQLLQDVARLAAKYKEKVCLHLAETASEIANCLAINRKTPVEYAVDCGLFEWGGVAFHGVHCNASDLRLLAKNKVSVVSCPGSNMKLASGVAPLRDFIDKGVPVALGTDSAASNNALDMWREMYLAGGLQNLKCNDANALSSTAIFDMAVAEGARVQGFDASAITTGSLADLIVINNKNPRLCPTGDCARNLVYAQTSPCVEMTMVGGRILYERGEFFVGESVDLIVKKCQNMINNIKRKI